MAYTPPPVGALGVVELSSAGYTPPSITSITVDLAVEEGGPSGAVEFIGVSGAISLAGFVPAKAIVVQKIGSTASLSLAGYTPVTHTTRTSVLSVAGALSITAFTPLCKAIKISAISAPGVLALAALQPTFFKGITQQIAVVGNLTLSAGGSVTHARSSHNEVSAGSLTLTAHGITHRVVHTISEAKGVTLTGISGVVQKQRIRVAIQSTYFTPDVTLDSPGTLSLEGNAGIVHAMRIRNSIVGIHGLMHSVYAQIVGKYTERMAVGFTSMYSTFSRVDAGVEALYSVKLVDTVRKGIESPYRFPVASSIISAYSLPEVIRVSRSINSAYSLPEVIRVSRSVVAPYSLPQTLNARVSVASPYTLVQTIKVRGVVDSLYVLAQNIPVRTEKVSTYALVQAISVRASIISAYSAVENLRVSSAVEGAYSFWRRVQLSAVSPYSLTSPARKSIEGYYGVSSIVRARSEVLGIYSSPDSQVLAILNEPYLEYFGKRIGIDEAELTVAEGEPYWKANVVLSNVADYVKLKQDQPFTVVIGAERYNFIVDSKELDRSNPANHAMKLLGISPSAKLSSPRHISTSYVWDTFVQAKAVAEELIPGIDWRVIDWAIPAYRFAVQDSTPIETVRVLAEAIGAALESNIDGSMYVRSLFPVSVPNYFTTTPVHVLLEATDIITVHESYVSFDTFNRLVVTDIAQDVSDSLEWIPDYTEATTGIMRAFLYPWRSAVSLLHTGLSGVSIQSPSLGMESHEEIIEVFQGAGSTQYPIHHIESVEYEAQNTGAIIFDVDSRSFTVAGPSFNSVLRLVYWTRSLDYRVALPTTRPTQFLLESAPL